MDQNLATDAETLTKTLCAHLAAARPDDLSAARGAPRRRAVPAPRRGVLDWIGCALAGSPHQTISRLVAVLQETGGRPQATVLGRRLKLGLLDEPLANGQVGHLLASDDSHLGGGFLHTSSPLLSSLFALAERAPVSGAEL